MIKSLYLDRVKKLKEVEDSYTLRGNRLLVEKLPDPELKTKTGIILNGDMQGQVNSIGADRPMFFLILDVGEGYVDDAGKISKDTMDIDIGDVVMIPKLSVKYFSIFADMEEYVPDTIGIARESDIEIRFKGVDGYEKYFRSLNK